MYFYGIKFECNITHMNIYIYVCIQDDPDIHWPAADIPDVELPTDILYIYICIQDDPDIHWPAADIPDVKLPTEFDWRTKNAVTPVKNQVFTKLPIFVEMSLVVIKVQS